jgi:hypothetical protein
VNLVLGGGEAKLVCCSVDVSAPCSSARNPHRARAHRVRFHDSVAAHAA